MEKQQQQQQHHDNDSMDVSKLNIEAVELIRQGNYGEAIGKLKQALTQVQTKLMLPLLDQWTETTQDECCCVAVDENPVDPLLLEKREEACVGCVPFNHPAGCFYLFNRCLILDGSPMIDEGCTTAVLCYNLAMVYHLKTLQGGGKSGAHDHQRALKMYDLIISMTRAVAASHNNRDGALILLLAMNNKGHLLSYLHQNDAATACFDDLCILVQDSAPWMLFGGIFSPIMLNCSAHFGKKQDHAPAA